MEAVVAGYRSIESLQHSSLGIRFGNAFEAGVDYAANAASLGCATWDVASEAELEAALLEAREQPRPAVIACRVDPEASVPASGAWWDLGVPEVAADPAVAAAAAEHARGRAGQRWYG